MAETLPPTVFRDPWLWILDKPAGMPSQPSPGTGHSLYERLCEVVPYVGLHHRLDQPASGLLLVTLDESVNAAIAGGFRTHQILRTYRAVLWGHARAALWTDPIEGRPARTHMEPLGQGSGFTAAEIRLETGRTHQIRRHAAQAGHPIAGDRRYGGEAGLAWDRLALHAARLELDHPVTGERLRVDAPLPSDLAPLWELAAGS